MTPYELVEHGKKAEALKKAGWVYTKASRTPGGREIPSHWDHPEHGRCYGIDNAYKLHLQLNPPKL